MWSGLSAILVLVAVVAVLTYAWKHRTGRLARGVGSAGAAYNELYGQGRPPEVIRPTAEAATPDKL